jgi:hypothetical protein
MRRFEYKVIRYLKELVNQLGDQGWEVVTWHDHQTEFLLKRERDPG